MTRSVKLKIGFLLFFLLSLYAAYAFATGLSSGVIECPGARCDGVSSRAAEPHAFWLFIGFYAISTIAMAVMAVLCFVQIFRDPNSVS